MKLDHMNQGPLKATASSRHMQIAKNCFCSRSRYRQAFLLRKAFDEPSGPDAGRRQCAHECRDEWLTYLTLDRSGGAYAHEPERALFPIFPTKGAVRVEIFFVSLDPVHGNLTLGRCEVQPAAANHVAEMILKRILYLRVPDGSGV